MRGISVALAMGAALTVGGCATLTRGTSDEVVVTSEPPGAVVTTSLGTGCAATPCTLDVARDAEFTVTLTKPGFASQSVAVTTQMSSTGMATATENLTTAGLGLAVDAATGAVLEHAPNPVSVVLASLSKPVAQAAKMSHLAHARTAP